MPLETLICGSLILIIIVIMIWNLFTSFNAYIEGKKRENEERAQFDSVPTVELGCLLCGKPVPSEAFFVGGWKYTGLSYGRYDDGTKDLNDKTDNYVFVPDKRVKTNICYDCVGKHIKETINPLINVLKLIGSSIGITVYCSCFLSVVITVEQLITGPSSSWGTIFGTVIIVLVGLAWLCLLYLAKRFDNANPHMARKLLLEKTLKERYGDFIRQFNDRHRSVTHGESPYK